MILLVLLFHSLNISDAFIADPFSLAQPHIQCTVVKVYSKKSIFGFKEFPKLYDGIFNDPLDSYMIISKKKIFDIIPKTIEKTTKSELIHISKKKQRLVMSLKGKPMSRNGTLSFNKEKIADLTCH